jgi:hypothetical protein
MTNQYFLKTNTGTVKRIKNGKNGKHVFHWDNLIIPGKWTDSVFTVEEILKPPFERISRAKVRGMGIKA